MRLIQKLIAIPMTVMVTASAIAQNSYSVEILEDIEPWPAGYVTVLQNQSEDYALIYRQTSSLRPKTVAVVNAKRWVLDGFQAEDINESGQMCGRLWIRGGERVGAVWDSILGFRVLVGGPQAYPSYLRDNGDAGGTLGWWNIPCYWIGGQTIQFPDVAGNICFVIEDLQMIAGHLPDGGHGTYPWLSDMNGKARWLGTDLALKKALPGGVLLGHRDSIGGGNSRLLYLSTGTQVRIWHSNSNRVTDMNSSFVGVGVTYHAAYAGDARPAIWFPVTRGQWHKADPLTLMPFGWSECWMLSITDEGTILALGRFKNGPLKVIRLRPEI